MAITLQSSPSEFMPAYNPVEWSFSSSNVNQCDFNYVCDLYINGDFAARLKTFPEGANDYGYFRIERILQDYLSFDLHRGLTGFAANENSIVDYYIEIYESFNSSADCTGTQTLSSVEYTSSTFYAWNGALQYHDSYFQNTYVATSNYSRFLTNIPDNAKIGIDDSFTINYLQDASAPVYAVIIRTYDSNMSLTGTYQLDSTFYTTPSTDELMVSVGVGPKNLNDATLSGSPFPSEPITSAVRYYSVQLVDSGLTPMSVEQFFEIDTRCSKFTSYRFWWLNRLGGFDSYSWNLKFFRNVAIDRNTFTKLLSTVYQIGDRGDKVISVKAKDGFVFNSNLLTEKEALWVEQLFTSPEVYVEYNAISTPQSYVISGAAHNLSSMTAYLVVEGVVIPVGTEFTYTVDDGSPIGMANSGSGTITGFDSITGYHTTTIPSSINAGALITGSLIAISELRLTPLIITSSSFEEKIKNNVKNIRYSIEATPSYDKNIQSL